ncbi:hypothetical protein P879_00733 [Paragonimus westermani]|uniref:HAP1 N-terminal domain-containing protein n=1 Tax=Paragonimus westermani TaxID=34504 RepID=A0A8T0CYR4_9TREM|nr:hypothetical protein P879_00733 [Paragonimus westermani]
MALPPVSPLMFVGFCSDRFSGNVCDRTGYLLLMADRGQAVCEHHRIQVSAAQSSPPWPSDHPLSDSTLSDATSGICLSAADLTGEGPRNPPLSVSTYSEPSLFGSSGLCESQYSTEPSKEQDQEDTLAEVELIRLVQPEPNLPLYRLRVDPCTAFVGYCHKDFRGARRATRKPRRDHPLPKFPSQLTTIPSVDELCETNVDDLSEPTESDASVDEEDPAFSLTKEQIERTLDYFLLCGLRVSQMARTYEDLDAITHLLEEKQNDLDLAAKIGKNLLDKNHELEQRLSEAEKKLVLTEDTFLIYLTQQINQLRHNLAIKDNLLQIYSRDHPDDAIEDHVCLSSGWLSPLPDAGPPSDSGFSMASVNFCQLNQKVRELEEENYVLRQEHSRLTATADQLDEHESALIRDCARQLVSANMHIRTLSDEMAKKSDAFISQQSEVTRLLTRGLDLENRVKQLAAENEMLVNRLNESQAAQHSLSNELIRLRDKYDECVALYNDTRSEVRALRKRSRRACLRSSYLLSPGNVLCSSMSSTPAQLFPSGSHADPDVVHSAPVNGSDGSSSSLELTVNGKTVTGELSEQSLASELAHTAVKDQAVINTDRLFRAMDLARQARYRLGDDYGGPDEAVSSSGFVSGSEPSERPHELSGFSTHSSTMHKHSSMSNARNTVCTAQENRLFIDPHFIEPSDELSETQLKRHSWLGCDFVSRAENNSLDRTDRITSQGSMDDSLLMTSDPSTVYSQSYSRTPQRLQLIKPLDGSEVLQQWQRLATPSFTRALFEAPLPGVQSRAGVCNSPTEVYSLITGNRTGSVGSNVPYASSLPTHCTYDPTCGTHAAEPVRGEVLQSSTTTIRQAPELSRRFGRTLPSQLLTAGVRSRSLEHLQSSFIRHNSRTGFTNYPPPVAPNTQEEPKSPPFSISSLVSAFLPFSLTPMCTDRRRSTDDTSSTEPIRIRPRSPPCSRGLLEVGKMDTDPISLQRVPVAAQTCGISTAIQKLPTAQPPPVLTQAYARPAHTRTLRNTNLSGITEESGSPPKPDPEVVKTDAKTVGSESRHDA